MMTLPAPSDIGTDRRYLEPGWFTRNVFNRLVRRLTRMGVSVLGSRELRVQGRSSRPIRASSPRTSARCARLPECDAAMMATSASLQPSASA